MKLSAFDWSHYTEGSCIDELNTFIRHNNIIGLVNKLFINKASELVPLKAKVVCEYDMDDLTIYDCIVGSVDDNISIHFINIVRNSTAYVKVHQFIKDVTSTYKGNTFTYIMVFSNKLVLHKDINMHNAVTDSVAGSGNYELLAFNKYSVDAGVYATKDLLSQILFCFSSIENVSKLNYLKDMWINLNGKQVSVHVPITVNSSSLEDIASVARSNISMDTSSDIAYLSERDKTLLDVIKNNISMADNKLLLIAVVKSTLDKLH